MAAAPVHPQPERRARLLGGGAEVEDAPVDLDPVALALVDGVLAADGLGMGLAQPLEAEAVAHLLVRRRHEDQVARGAEALACERGDRHCARRHLPLHVEGAAPPDLPVHELAGPRVELPLPGVGEDGVRVGEEAEPRPVARARDARDEVRPLGHPRVELAGDAVRLEVAPEVLGRDRLVARRVHGVEPDQLLEEPRHLVTQRDGCHRRRPGERP